MAKREDNKKMSQYQDKIKQLNQAQDEAFSQMSSRVKWGGPLMKWKTIMRGALKEASNDDDNLLKKFENEWRDTMLKHGISEVNSKTSLEDKAYEELINLIQDYQQELGMGFTRTKKPEVIVSWISD